MGVSDSVNWEVITISANPDKEWLYALDTILEQPLTRLRVKLYEVYADKKRNFKLTELKDFLNEIQGSVIDDSFLRAEIDNAVHAYEKAEPITEPNLKTPETQLVWAATLLALHKGLEHDKSTINQKWVGLPYFNELTDHPVWRAVLDTQEASSEMIRHGHYVHEGLHRQDTRFKWSGPEEYFAYDPKKNQINVNLMLSLLNGFEHSRAILFHQIGHSQISTKYMPSMTDIRTRMEPIVDKTKNRQKITPFEYINLRMFSAEWQLRNKLFEATENNVVNRYTANMGGNLAQEYAYSLNNYIVHIGGFGSLRQHLQKENEFDQAMEELMIIAEGTPLEIELEECAATNGNIYGILHKHKDDLLKDFFYDVDTSPLKRLLESLYSQASVKNALVENLQDVIARRKIPTASETEQKQAEDGPKDEVQEAYQRFLHVLHAINMVFYKNNYLFENTREGWLSVGVDPDKIKITDPSFQHDKDFNKKHEGDDFPSADMAYLIELCGGEGGLEHLQTSARDRWMGRDFFRKKANDMADKRNAIAEKIWDLYLKADVDILLNQVRQNVESQLERAWSGSSDSTGLFNNNEEEDKPLLYPQGGDHPHPVDTNDRFNPLKAGTSEEGNQIEVDFRGSIGRDGKPLWKQENQQEATSAPKVRMQPK